MVDLGPNQPILGPSKYSAIDQREMTTMDQSLPKRPNLYISLKTSISVYGIQLLALIILIACTVLALLGYIFYVFEKDVARPLQDSGQSDLVKTGAKTIPTYLALFIFAECFHILLTIEALWSKNVIELIGLCFFTLAKLVDAAVQYAQIKNVVDSVGQSQADIAEVLNGWKDMKGFVIAIPAIEGVEWVVQIYLTYLLYREFGWAIYKNVGADISLKRRYFCYLVFATILKFDFFFFLGFTIQFLVVGKNISSTETGLTATVIPLTIVFIYLVMVALRKEMKVLMLVFILVFFCGLAYFFFKLVRIFSKSHEANYFAARKTLTLFAVITIVLLLASVAMSVVCIFNMDKGLKPVIDKSSIARFAHSKGYRGQGRIHSDFSPTKPLEESEIYSSSSYDMAEYNTELSRPAPSHAKRLTIE